MFYALTLSLAAREGHPPSHARRMQSRSCASRWRALVSGLRRYSRGTPLSSCSASKICRGVRSYTRHPAKLLAASPRELLVSPSELLASPSELLASPSELSASPSELLASPSETQQ
jgi:hypothetical protein